MSNRVYSVIHLTKPRGELEIYVFSEPNTQIVYHYLFRESEEGRTHLVQKVRFEKVNNLLANFVFDRAIQTQRALLANLKVRLEKVKLLAWHLRTCYNKFNPLLLDRVP